MSEDPTTSTSASEKDPGAAPSPQTDQGAASSAGPGVTIAGIGASAGGLEAVQSLLQAFTEAPGLALVLVQHLSAEHESALPRLLSSVTSLSVAQVTEGTVPQADHVYVIPPDRQMRLEADGTLRLTPRPHEAGQHLPIDVFFRSLAEHAGNRAVAVLLSGTGSDGVVGMREIKGVGGITLAQNPDTAKHDGMPRAAIGNQVVDRVLAPDALAAELGRIGGHPYLQSAAPEGPAPDESDEEDTESLSRVFAVLRHTSGVDFSPYKRGTIRRRLSRRMALHQLQSLEAYVEQLEQDPTEVERLYEDMLIHVTRFFREPEAFDRLQEIVLPAITENRSPEEPIRVWVPGCSTGEDAYATAIALREHLEKHAESVPIQVFGTDVSSWAVEAARAGVYPEAIAADVSSDRLKRFFIPQNSGYRVSKAIRDACIFARHDLTRDPPFSRMDLIVCRNLLIYLGVSLQKRLLHLLHYALKPRGHLMLGGSESPSAESELFALTDKAARLYTRRAVESHPRVPTMVEVGHHPPAPQTSAPETRSPAGTAQQRADRMLLDRYGPPGVLVDDSLQIVQIRGQTGRFLEPSPGTASLNLLKMAREGLLQPIRSAVEEARATEQEARTEDLRVEFDAQTSPVDLVVIPVRPAGEGRHFLVLFEEGGAAAQAPQRAPAPPPGTEEESERVRVLEKELRETRSQLQSTIQELEAANEELQSANEEVLSSNEELQSTNEELDTAKEELESSNEELSTVNHELKARNEELQQANGDLENLLANVDVGAVILDQELCVRRYTPMAETLFNLVPEDVGRAIGRIRPQLRLDDLEGPIRRALDEDRAVECDAQDPADRWYRLRARPYKDTSGDLNGAVVTVFDVHDARTRAQEIEIERARVFADAILDTMRQPLVVLDERLCVRMLNGAFCEAFGVERAAAVGRPFFELNEGQWQSPELRRLLEEVLPQDTAFEDQPLETTLDDRRRRLRLDGRRLDVTTEGEPLILLGIREEREEDG